MPSPTGLDPFVFAAVLVAAALHAGWNALLKIKLAPFQAMTLVTVAGGVLAVPMVAVFGWPRSESWPYLALSCVFHVGYYLGLISAYSRADMGQVYPLARGSAPLMTAVAAALMLREPVGAVAALGIATLGAGILLMSLKGGRASAPRDPATIGWALLTAVTICLYTLSDGTGARVSGNAHAYAAALFVVDAACFLAFGLWWKGAAAIRGAFVPTFLAQGFAGGAMSLGAYWIAIWAMTVAPIALVAALRESSVLFAALISVVILREPLSRPRMIAAALILAGLVLIRLQ